jgi:hypothetical protein
MKTHKTGSIRVTVPTEYDIHSIILSQRTVARVLRGARVAVKGQGFYVEGERTQDLWEFNTIEAHSLTVTCDDGFDVFAGTIEEATIEKI